MNDKIFNKVELRNYLWEQREKGTKALSVFIKPIKLDEVKRFNFAGYKCSAWANSDDFLVSCLHLSSTKPKHIWER